MRLHLRLLLLRLAWAHPLAGQPGHVSCNLQDDETSFIQLSTRWPGDAELPDEECGQENDETALLQGLPIRSRSKSLLINIDDNATDANSNGTAHDREHAKGPESTGPKRGESVDRKRYANNFSNIIKTSAELLYHEIELELVPSPNGARFPMRNKLALVLMESLILPAFCGFDRCFMGQPCLGCIKAVSLGGFGIWFLFDYIVVLINTLGMRGRIWRAGFCAYFDPAQIYVSLEMSMVFLSLKCLLCIFLHKRFKGCRFQELRELFEKHVQSRWKYKSWPIATTAKTGYGESYHLDLNLG